jgi:hypothetical protein
MKLCAYCGRGNEDEHVFCKECGTQIPESPAVTTPSKARDLAGVRFAFLGVSTLFVVFALYLLSFGPVTRWCVTQSTIPPSGVVTNGPASTFMVTYTVSCPAWVGVVYYPLLDLIPPGDGEGLTGLYQQYLAWWEKSPDTTR